MTVFTDYGLAAVAGALGARLWARSEGQVCRRLWAACFLTVAVAAVAGGTWHGWSPRMTRPAADSLWLVTYAFVGLGNVLILAGAAWAVAGGALRTVLAGAAAVRFLVWFAFIVRDPDFRYVVYDYAGTLLALLVVAAVLARRDRAAACWIAAGVAVSLMGAAVQRARLAPASAFNHNDLFHVVQAAGLYLYFRAGRRLEDADPIK
jgi:hypothetical protein